MPLKIAPTSVHEITKASLVTPEHLTAFGKVILGCCLESREIFMLSALCLNYDSTTQKYDKNDFLDFFDGLVFSAMQAFLTTYHEGNPWPSTRLQWCMAISPHIDHCIQQHPELSDMHKTGAMTAVMTTPACRMGDHDRLCDGLIDYVTGVRYHMLELTSKHHDPARRRLDFDAVPRSIRIPGAEAEAVDNELLLTSIFSVNKSFKPIYSGVNKFDQTYGSRAMPGDAWLAYGCPGGGKTNLACQFAGFTAHAGKKVMIITTEVKPAVMMMRACSAVSRIPYNTLRSMVGTGDNHPMAKDFVRWVREGPGKNIKIYDYAKIPGNDFNERLARMLESYERENGGMPELTILDWVGKAADSGFTTAWEKREGYSRIGTRMADLADEVDGCTLTLAQAKPEAKNKTNLTEFMTADCQALSQPFEGVIGITSLCETAEGGGEDQEVHKKGQYWVVCKCREEVTMRLSVNRQFDIAKFSDH